MIYLLRQTILIGHIGHVFWILRKLNFQAQTLIIPESVTEDIESGYVFGLEHNLEYL